MNIRKIDLHMHSTVSDGTDTPEELLLKVKQAGIDLFALTDHDDYKGYDRIRRIRQQGDPILLSGVEFSCEDEEGKYHVLGYNFDPRAESILQVMELGHRYRVEKVALRVDHLKKVYGVTFPQAEVDGLYALDNPGKPHIANLMVKYGYVKSKEQAFADYLNSMSFPNEHIRPDQAIQAILHANGIPVLAHPAFGSGEELIVGEALRNRICRLIGFGLRGIEAFYSGFSPKLQNEVLAYADEYGLLVTAGSDYHGKNKLVVLGDTNHELCQGIPAGMRHFFEETGVGNMVKFE